MQTAEKEILSSCRKMATFGSHRAIRKMSDIHETEPAVLKERDKFLKSEIARAKVDDDQILIL